MQIRIRRSPRAGVPSGAVYVVYQDYRQAQDSPPRGGRCSPRAQSRTVNRRDTPSRQLLLLCALVITVSFSFFFAQPHQFLAHTCAVLQASSERFLRVFKCDSLLFNLFFSFLSLQLSFAQDHFEQLYVHAAHAGYACYVAHLDGWDLPTCASRNVHGHSQGVLEALESAWEPSPAYMTRLDTRAFAGGSIPLEHNSSSSSSAGQSGSTSSNSAASGGGGAGTSSSSGAVNEVDMEDDNVADYTSLSDNTHRGSSGGAAQVAMKGSSESSNRWGDGGSDDDDHEGGELRRQLLADARPPSPPRARNSSSSNGSKQRVTDRWGDVDSDDEVEHRAAQAAAAAEAEAAEAAKSTANRSSGEAPVVVERKRKRVGWADDDSRASGDASVTGGKEENSEEADGAPARNPLVQVVEFGDETDAATASDGLGIANSTDSGGGGGGFELGAVARAKQKQAAAITLGQPLKSALAKATEVFAATAADNARAEAAAAAAAAAGGSGSGQEQQRKRLRVRGWLSGDADHTSDGRDSAGGSGGANDKVAAVAADFAGSNHSGSTASSSGSSGSSSGFLARLRDEQAQYAAATLHVPSSSTSLSPREQAGIPAAAAAAEEPEPEKKDRWGSDSDSE